ncbi:hypothetical protein WN51_03272 [Melipona quadrifasciata]|uniref:Uncharacterized protein n=1 Tax=Melipona quadrifasciata TaxID=166423 RepID=A0A0M8ZYL2_9HYME|nr:hypothetical protein WN51_03272 [Melipona quadrifasciata]
MSGVRLEAEFPSKPSGSAKKQRTTTVATANTISEHSDEIVSEMSIHALDSPVGGKSLVYESHGLRLMMNQYVKILFKNKGGKLLTSKGIGNVVVTQVSIDSRIMRIPITRQKNDDYCFHITQFAVQSAKSLNTGPSWNLLVSKDLAGMCRQKTLATWLHFLLSKKQTMFLTVD